MKWTSWFDGPSCRSCGQSLGPHRMTCTSCGEATWIPPKRGLSSIHSGHQGEDVWAFADWLPIEPDGPGSRPGGTPTVAVPWLAEECQGAAVAIKDEGRNPTGHLSDRDMAVVRAAAACLERDGLGLPSPGRSGVAAAAAAGDLDTSVFVPSRAPFPTKAMINVHGASMTVVGGRYPDAVAAYEDARAAESWWPAEPYTNPYARAGRATLYLELLARANGTPPDTIVIPTGSGATVVAIADAARACRNQGITDRLPRLVVAQPEGCAPIVEAIASEEQSSTPDTICGELEIPHPPGRAAVMDAIAKTGGEAIAVPDPAALEAAVRLADRSGLSVSVAGGVAAAAATDLSSVGPDDSVVIVNPGAGGLDADILRSHLMSQGV